MIFAQPIKPYSVLNNTLYAVEALTDDQVGIRISGATNWFARNRFNLIEFKYGIGDVLTCVKDISYFKANGFYRIIALELTIPDFDVWYKLESGTNHYLVKQDDLSEFFTQ